MPRIFPVRCSVPGVGLLALLCLGSASAGTINIQLGTCSLCDYSLSGTAAFSTANVFNDTGAVRYDLPDTNVGGRVRIDIASDSLTLNSFASASYWVNKDIGVNAEQSPYLIFSLGSDSLLAVMYNNPSIPSDGQWHQMGVSPGTQFHVEGSTSDFTNPISITLAQIAATNKTGGGTWGDVLIPFVRLSAGSGGSGNGHWTAYADDLTITTTSATNTTPEPGSAVLMLGGGLLLLVGSLRRRQTAQSLR